MLPQKRKKNFDVAIKNPTYFKIKSLSPQEKKNGVVAASAGNHAQGVAFASSLEKIPCTIVMPKNASPAKVAATKGYGANVILEGKN